MFSQAYTYADIDGDGDVDLFSAPMDQTPTNNGTDGTPVNVRMYRNNGGVFTQDDTVWAGSPIPSTIWGRKALTGDYNGDGKPDFAVIATGWDAPPFPGAPPLVLLSSANGTYTKATGLDGIIGFHHGGASGDIDNDGDIDIFLTSGGGNIGVPLFLINDGSGNFTANTDRVPCELTGAVPLFSAELIDIDGDGYLDLQVGGVEPPSGSLPTTIYWGSTTGYYSAAQSTQLPTAPGFTDQLDFDARDLDGDSKRDLLITRTSHNYLGYSIQYLHNNGNRTFTDVTAARITGGNSKTIGYWIDWVRVGDANGDGFVDIYTENTDSYMPYAVWINDGAGNFTFSLTGSTLPLVSVPQGECIPPLVSQYQTVNGNLAMACVLP